MTKTSSWLCGAAGKPPSATPWTPTVLLIPRHTTSLPTVPQADFLHLSGQLWASLTGRTFLNTSFTFIVYDLALAGFDHNPALEWLTVALCSPATHRPSPMVVSCRSNRQYGLSLRAESQFQGYSLSPVASRKARA